MVKTYNFSQTFITALVEFKLTELCETAGMELLIAPTSLLACDDTKGFFNSFISPTSRTWRNYFATSLLIRIPAYHTNSGNLTKIYFMTRNKTVDDCIIVPSGFIIAVKEFNSDVAINEGYLHYDVDYGIDTSAYINVSTSITDNLIEDLTTKIAQRLFQVIQKYYN